MNIKQILNNEQYIDKELIVNGWITTERKQKNILFISLNDGSCFNNLQIVIDMTDDIKNKYNDLIVKLTRGVSLQIFGKIIKSPNKGQLVEMSANIDNVVLLGEVDANTYPLSKMKHPPEFIRQFPHLRVRTNLGGVVARIRNTCSKATHDFFQNRGFLYVHTPLMTANDCEGAGETFQIIPTNTKKFDEFFGTNVNLTVSGQLHGESYAVGLTNIYTFGPTFRAEKSNTSRHLAEFWMVEPEMCFINFEDLMDISEKHLQYCIKLVLENNKDDIEFINKHVSKGRYNMLVNMCENKFKRISYSEAINMLMQDYNASCGYSKVEEWGIDLNSEHEKYLVKKCGPIIVYNYPKKIKSFYMKVNEQSENNQQTVQSMDMLVPDIGEIIGGSMRETNLSKLETIMTEKGVGKELDWYLDLRRYGSVEHGGYGLGFERLIMLITGVNNIKDTIPYPRYYGKCSF